MRWRLAGLLAAVSVAAAADGAGLVWDAEPGAEIAVPDEAELACDAEPGGKGPAPAGAPEVVWLAAPEFFGWSSVATKSTRP